ncbi:MAG: hypothetical protein II763_04660, partial [Bacteroidales bacterium]|nr:hypothetical protein [Bacteroidales bacterium]
VKAHLAAGDPFVLRILADGDPEKKTKFTDLVKGNLEVPLGPRKYGAQRPGRHPLGGGGRTEIRTPGS